ncbi:tyrosine-type recombinase/integrase [Patescibacteria group bacterium]|nr:tyrosine-type recombinase/integrase [Patescibacteria group bacterium]
MPNQSTNLIKTFLTDLENQGKNNLTIKNYQLYLKKFALWLKTKNLSLPQVDSLVIKNFAQSLANQQPTLKNNTINYHLTALRSFNRFLKNKNLSNLKTNDIKLNPLKRKTVTKEIDPTDKLHQAIQSTLASQVINLRDSTIIELLLTNGLKVSEVSNLTKADVDFEKKELTVKKSKHTRKLILTAESQQLLINYLKERHDTDPALFINHDRAAKSAKRTQKINHNLSSRSIQRLIAYYGRLAGLEKPLTPSHLRKIYSQKLIQNKIPTIQIKSLLGYKHTSSINWYKPSQVD